MKQPVKHDSNRDASLARVLRVLGCIDLLALVAVAAPRAWLEGGHQAAGLGELPAGPVVGYLARSASVLYALHGAVVVFLSFDVHRYRPLIRFLAILALVHGGIMLAIDWNEALPLWWRVVEGPGFAATGGLVLLFLRPAKRQGP